MRNYFDERVVDREQERVYHEEMQLPERIHGVQYYYGYTRSYHQRRGAIVLCHLEGGEIIYDLCGLLPRYAPVQFIDRVKDFYQPKLMFVN